MSLPNYNMRFNQPDGILAIRLRTPKSKSRLLFEYIVMGDGTSLTFQFPNGGYIYSISKTPGEYRIPKLENGKVFPESYFGIQKRVNDQDFCILKSKDEIAVSDIFPLPPPSSGLALTDPTCVLRQDSIYYLNILNHHFTNPYTSSFMDLRLNILDF